MGWQATLLVAPTLFAVAIACLLTGYGLIQLKDGPREPIIGVFFWISVATVVWTGFSALKLLHTDPRTKLLFYRLLHVGAAALPPLLFFFVVGYTDRTRWLRPAVVGGIFFLPAVFVVLLFLNPANIFIGETEVLTNGLVILRVSDAPGFLVFLAYSTILVVAALGLLLSETRRVGPAYYPQAVLLGVALLVPIVFSILTAASIPPFTAERINLVPTSAAISTAALGLLLGRYRLFDVPPLAYATAMKYSPDGLFVLDRNERIVHANDRGSEILAELGAQSGGVLTDYLPSFDPDRASEDLLEIPVGEGEIMYQRLLVEGLTRGGRPVGWVVVLRDETAQQRRQQELQRRNEQLDMFTTTVSHDLRNPLAVAKGFLEIAREEGDAESFDRIEAAHTRMEEIIEQLLVLAREGEEIDAKEPVMLPEIIEQAWEAVDTTSAELVVNVDGSLLADASMLQHIFENLFRNAIEHNEGDVQVTVGPLDDGFFVVDDGSGIPKGDEELVFTPGYSTSSEGTGFGLQLVEAIVKAHGWSVTVVAGEAGGARFEIIGVEFVA